jgi:hypothetical protein
MYGAVYGFNSPFSGEVMFHQVGISGSYGAGEMAHFPRASRVRNFGAKLGYNSRYRGFKYNVEASYLKDFRDTSFFLANEHDPLIPISVGSAIEEGLQRAAVYELHGYVVRGPVDFLVDYAALTRRIDNSAASKAPYPNDRNSRMWAYSLRGGYWFNTYGRRSKVMLGYERAGHTVLTTRGVSGITGGAPCNGVSRLNPARYTPRFRYIFDYIVKLGRGTSLGLQYTYSRDFRDVYPLITDDDANSMAHNSATTCKARLSVAF